MARRLGAVRVRLVIVSVAVLAAAIAIYWFLVRTGEATPRVEVPRLAARIGSGSAAVGVSADGSIVRWLPLPEHPALPELPLSRPPKEGRVRGPALQQVRVLAAVPDALRPYVEASRFGEEGVVVTLTTGIELRFGEASQPRRKWQAAAAVLADPAVSRLDSIDLSAPSRPALEGSGHELPPAP